MSHEYGTRWLDLALPTYVSDWTARVVHFDVPVHLDRCGSIEQGVCNACGKSPPELMTAEGRAASRGIVVDTIHETVVTYDVKQRKLFELYCACVRRVKELDSPYASTMDALWKPLCGELIRH